MPRLLALLASSAIVRFPSLGRRSFSVVMDISRFSSSHKSRAAILSPATCRLQKFILHLSIVLEAATGFAWYGLALERAIGVALSTCAGTPGTSENRHSVHRFHRPLARRFRATLLLSESSRMHGSPAVSD